MIRQYLQLKRNGVLGINRRNLDYMLKYNSRDSILLVDDKLQTKQKAIQNHMAVPELYKIIQFQSQIENFDESIKDHSDFVIKPSRGAGGKGIIIIAEKRDNTYFKINGAPLSVDELKSHMARIVSGVFSLGGNRDTVMLEYRVKSHPTFKDICFNGVPDIRIIVYKGFPVMAMGRFPTFYSDGKANLHQGAIGVAIDLATGVTGNGVLKQEYITHHPDTHYSIRGRLIPYWDQLLEISAKCFELTGLGYMGVDLVIDENLGPMMLEINARPGLNIQIANQDGLWRRLKLLESHQAADLSPTARIKHALQVLKEPIS